MEAKASSSSTRKGHGIGTDQLAGQETSGRLPWWGGIAQAAGRSGVSGRLVEEYAKDGLIRSANVRRPGATRGRVLIDMWSLFDFIEQGINASPAQLAMNSNKEEAE